jgi:hypothetical protein
MLAAALISLQHLLDFSNSLNVWASGNAGRLSAWPEIDGSQSSLVPSSAGVVP